MERAHNFTIDEYYHLYSRGVDKSDIFRSEKDTLRFQSLLYLCNSVDGILTSNIFNKKYRGEPSIQIFETEKPGKTLVDIVAYALMPNHIHIVVREKNDKGISKFMLKLMTSYVMYFNTKYERSGPLFTRPFRSRHVDSDEYFKWLFSYVHLNPLELFDRHWKQKGLTNQAQAHEFMSTYPYSSFPDYDNTSRSESCIIEKKALPIEGMSSRSFTDLLNEFAQHASQYALISP